MTESEEHREIKHRVARQWSEKGYETDTEVRVGIGNAALRVDAVALSESHRVAFEVGTMRGGEERVKWLLKRFDKVVHVPLPGRPDFEKWNGSKCFEYLKYDDPVQEVVDAVCSARKSMTEKDVAVQLEISESNAGMLLRRAYERGKLQQGVYFVDRGEKLAERVDIYFPYFEVVRNKIVRNMRSMAERRNEKLKRRQYELLGEFPIYAVEEAFGTWDAAKEAAEID